MLSTGFVCLLPVSGVEHRFCLSVTGVEHWFCLFGNLPVSRVENRFCPSVDLHVPVSGFEHCFVCLFTYLNHRGRGAVG